MKNKKKALDNLDMVINSRPMTAKEKAAIQEYIKKDQLKRKKSGRKRAA